MQDYDFPYILNKLHCHIQYVTDKCGCKENDYIPNTYLAFTLCMVYHAFYITSYLVNISLFFLNMYYITYVNINGDIM